MLYWLFSAAILLGMIGFQSVKSETTTPELEHQWPTGFKMNIRLQVLKKVTGGWTMTLRFTKPAPGLHIWRAKIVSVSKDKKVYKLKNMLWNPTLDKCSVLKMAFVADKGEQGKPAPEAFVEFLRKGECVCNSNLDETACSTQKTNQPMTTSQKSQTSAANRFPPVPPVGGQTTKATILDDWNIGFKMIFRFLIREPVNEGWMIRIKFSKPALHLQIWRSEIISVSDDKKTYFVRNMSYNKVLAKCTVLVIDFLAYKETLDESAPEADITFYRNGPAVVPTSDNTACATTMPTRDPTTS